MPQNPAGIPRGCVILPFSRNSEKAVKATTMAALVAVTIVHDAETPAEERLIEIIEASGEAEVLDTDDVLADLGLEEPFTEDDANMAANDNAPLTVI